MSLTPADVQPLLVSENLGDRLKGVNLLREIDPAIAFKLIQPLITDTNERVRYAAVSQLDPLGKQDPETALSLLRDRIQNDTELDVKAAAADVIGGLQLTEAYDDLQQLYHQTSDWLLQLSIIATLGELGEPKAIELLEVALQSDNELLRVSAVSALGELGSSEAIPLLVQLVKDEDWQVRYRLVQALVRLGGEEAQQTIKILAEDPIEQVAKEAKENLA